MKTVRVLVVMGWALSLPALLVADPLRVRTEQGAVHGKTIHDGKVRAFLGVPYAAPPLGDLRWKAPRPRSPWKGVRDATKFGSHCLQPIIPNDDTLFADSGPSEDCLFLNVYTPTNATASSRLPVMFWIHGGGFLLGAGSEPRHGGGSLPTKGIVLITINYRLGVFGFLATRELANETGGAAGNYGLLDMVAALRWVKNNIGAFGGNPDNVTIFGESAGSFSVSTLMASQLARGLFQKAIGESGSAISPGPLPVEPLEIREKTDGEWVASLGITTLAALRAMPAAVLLKASNGKPQFVEDIDGKLLIEPLADTYAAGRQAHVPLLAGWMRQEDTSLGNGMTAENWKAFAAVHFKEHTAEFLALYPGGTDEQAAQSAADFGGDTFIAFCTWRWIEAQRKTGFSDAEPSVYRYRFDLAAPPSKFHPGSLAFHGDDIEYVFGSLDTRPESVWRTEDHVLSEQMMSYWTNFAKTGDPNGPGLPAWPKYGAGDPIIHLDSPISRGPDRLRTRYEFLVKAQSWIAGR